MTRSGFSAFPWTASWSASSALPVLPGFEWLLSRPKGHVAEFEAPAVEDDAASMLDRRMMRRGERVAGRHELLEDEHSEAGGVRAVDRTTGQPVRWTPPPNDREAACDLEALAREVMALQLAGVVPMPPRPRRGPSHSRRTILATVGPSSSASSACAASRKGPRGHRAATRPDLPRPPRPAVHDVVALTRHHSPSRAYPATHSGGATTCTSRTPRRSQRTRIVRAPPASTS